MKKTLSVLAAFGFVLGMSGMAMAAITGGLMHAEAVLANACTVSAAEMNFTTFGALQSEGDQVADTNGSLQIACTNGTTPLIYADATRVLTNGVNSITFFLGQTPAEAALDGLSTDTGDSITEAGYTSDGALHAVTLYGNIPKANFLNKPQGTYSADITVSVNY